MLPHSKGHTSSPVCEKCYEVERRWRPRQKCWRGRHFHLARSPLIWRPRQEGYVKKSGGLGSLGGLGHSVTTCCLLAVLSVLSALSVFPTLERPFTRLRGGLAFWGIS